MMGFFDAETMELIPGEPEFLRWCRGRAPSEKTKNSLFVYRSRASHRFMLGAWVTERGIFDPLLEIGADLHNVNKKTTETFLAIMYPNAGRNIKEGLKEAAYNDQVATENLDADREYNRAKILKDEYDISTRGLDGTVMLPAGVLAG
jgi:hypothetical protein